MGDREPRCSVRWRWGELSLSNVASSSPGLGLALGRAGDVDCPPTLSGSTIGRRCSAFMSGSGGGCGLCAGVDSSIPGVAVATGCGVSRSMRNRRRASRSVGSSDASVSASSADENSSSTYRE